jgi:lactoylglutathione lyase
MRSTFRQGDEVPGAMAWADSRRSGKAAATLRHGDFANATALLIFRTGGPPRAGLGLSQKVLSMRYLHTMVRVGDLDAALDFYCAKLGLKEVRRHENAKGRFTLVFLATPEDAENLSGEKTSDLRPMVELTYNWDEKNYSGGRNFGHLAYAVGDIYALCGKLMAAGVPINRPPRDGQMAFIRSPDGISIELLQQGNALPPQEPWLSMPNTGVW